jgi:predicted alternative tryptophan synthase beta-subunit
MLGRRTEQVMREFCSTRIPRPTALFRGRRLEEDLETEARPHLEMAARVNTRS